MIRPEASLDTVDLVVFDMAGTTIVDRGEVPDAFIDALHQHGVQVTAAEFQSWRGASKREVLRTFVARQFGGSSCAEKDRRVEEAYAAFRRSLERSYVQHGARAMLGAETTFGWLRDRGIKVALTTGFYRRVTDLILEAVGWHAEVVDVSICSDDVRYGRPAPYMIFKAMEVTGVTDVRRVVKAGDTVLDLLAGQNAGAGMVVGVLSGSGTREQLTSVEQAQIVSSIAELPTLLT